MEPVHFSPVNREFFTITASGSWARIWLVSQLFEVITNDSVGLFIGVSQKFSWLFP